MGSSNFRALLRRKGEVVPGSIREGHNVFTDLGRAWMSRLVAWSQVALSEDDIAALIRYRAAHAMPPLSPEELADLAVDHPYTDLRIRGVQVGSGYTHPGPAEPERREVKFLTAPLVVRSIGPGQDIYEQEVSTSFPFCFGIRYTAVFEEDEILPLESIIQEAGLCVGAQPSSLPSGDSCTVDYQTTYTRITGLHGIEPWMEGMYLSSGSIGSGLRITTVYDPTTVDLEFSLGGGPASFDWYVGGGGLWGEKQPVVAYKAFAPLVKTRDFQLEIQWDLRF